jgi:glycosyltransferase involved in cell wall biosynthesis
MTKSLKASIVVCTYNRMELLETCLTAANAQSVSRNEYEILVIENSLDDQTFGENKKKFSKYSDKFLRSKPPGLSIARNLGWRNSASDIVIYLDDDAIPDRFWLSEILNAYKEFPNAFSVGGRVDPLLQIEPPEWLTTEMFDYLSVVNYGSKNISIGANKWLVGANISFKKNFLIECNGFPEDLGRIGTSNSLLSNDETPLFNKIYALNKEVVYSGKALVKHLVPNSRLTKSWLRKRVIWQAISDVIKGDKLSDAQISDFKIRYANLSKGDSLVGRSIFGLLSHDSDLEIFPGKFSDEIGHLYMCVRYLIETGSDI